MIPIFALIAVFAPATPAAQPETAPVRQPAIPAEDVATAGGDDAASSAPSSHAQDPSGVSSAPDAPTVPAPVAEHEVHAEHGVHTHDDGETHADHAEHPTEQDPWSEDEKKKKKKKKKELEIVWKGRIVAGYRLKIENPAADQPDDASTKHSLQLRQARVAMKGEFRKTLRVKVSADFADFLSTPAAGDVLRDAWANVKVHKLFQVTVGEFKRPYSALELRGVSGLHLVSRGLFNSAGIEDLGWGDRAAGVMLWGKTKPKKPGLHRVSWAVSVTNDAVSGGQDGFDTHARLTYAPIKKLTFGATGALKAIEDGDGEWRNAYGGDVDITFKHKGLIVGAEADYGQDWLYQESNGDQPNPGVLGVFGYASYDIELGEDWVLQPAATFEYADTNMLYGESESIRAVGNFNVRWTEHLVLRPQVEWVHPLPTVTAFNQFTETQIYGLWLQVQI
jgi:hypothetical protein